MSSEVTIDAVRLALSMQEMQARTASMNIANASKPDARALRLDFAVAQSLLADVAQGRVDGGDALELANLEIRSLTPGSTPEAIQVDEQVGDMVASSVAYQSLSEALSRHFGLMRLATTGRS